MMICPNCGCAVPEGAQSCACCGELLSRCPGATMPVFTIPESGVPADVSVPSPAPVPVKQGTHWIPLVIMALICVLGLSLFFALPDDPGTEAPVTVVESETPWFRNVDGTLYFVEELYTGPAEVTVPETVDGLPVERLGAECFAYCDQIVTVILPESLVAIEDHAFAGCTAMRGIFIPEGVAYIGAEAFRNCVSLEAICIPSTAETIGDCAFDDCGKLAHIFYNGIHSHWKDLYSDYISIKTQVYCTDGTFVHRHTIP